MINSVTEKTFNKDLYTIENDLITKQKDGKYCKFSRLLNQVVIIGLTKEQYIKYYQSRWVGDDEKQKILLEACEAKFNNGLISNNEMIELINNSDDDIVDKPNALKKLKGER